MAVVLFVTIGIVVALIKMSLGKNAKAKRALWVRGAYSIWTGGEDSGTWNQARAANSLRDWYGVSTGNDFWEVIRGLRAGTTGNPAWDRVRALDLLRIAHAAQLIDDEGCWNECARIGQELQQAYPSWDALAQGFESGMHAWQRSRGQTDQNEISRVQRNLPALRGQIWPGVGFKTELVLDD